MPHTLGYDRGVRPLDCNFIRGHDFFSLMAENHTRARLSAMNDGTVSYDLPPYAVFDQKIALALPFLRTTRNHYPAEVRALFPHTHLITPTGLELEDGSSISPEEFSALSRSRRCYYLKYAGPDVSLNWGSKAVFHLGRMSREECSKRLCDAVADYAAGRPWIVQQALSDKTDVTYVQRDGTLKTFAAHSKTSAFYGSDGLLGVLLMHEAFHKVHGSADTVVTIAVEG